MRNTARADEVSARELSLLAAEHHQVLVPQISGSAVDIGLNLVRVANKYSGTAEENVLRQFDLRWGSFSLLFMVSLFPGAEARDLSRLAGVTRQATSQTLKSLENRELISRKRSDPTDQRLLEVRLTEAGDELLRDVMAAHLENTSAWFERISEDERGQLNGILRKILAD